jgi:Arylsulfotransferase (ASST)
VSGVVQEIDVATGDVVFEWDSLDHVPVTETQAQFSGGTPQDPFDYFHINSIAVAPDGDLLVSSRHTWTVYKIGRHDGKIVWRLGGKKSDFTFGPDAKFAWQHHARVHGTDLLTVFDNASSPPEEAQSRGLILRLDTQNMHATLVRAFTHPAGGLLADNQGSMQLLPGNRAFVGWGAQPFFTEFDADGSVLLNGHLPVGDQSYRAFTADWTGHPTDKPALAVTANPARGIVAYVSWNGATEVASWRVHAGKRESSLDVVATLPRSRFETVIPANSTGPYFAVTAHDSSGRLIGQSAIVRSNPAAASASSSAGR